MNARKFATVTAAVAALGAFSVSDAVAQACFGTPTIAGQRAISGGVGFPNGGTNYHARLDVNTGTPVSYQASYSHTAVPGANVNTIGGGVAYELPSAIVPGGTPIRGCPMIGASYAMVDGDGDERRLDVPVGFGLGTRVYMGAGMSLVPYVAPQLVFSRTSVGLNGDRVTTTDHGLGATVGSAVDFGPFFAGVDYTTTRWNDVPATDNRFGVRVGLKF